MSLKIFLCRDLLINHSYDTERWGEMNYIAIFKKLYIIMTAMCSIAKNVFEMNRDFRFFQMVDRVFVIPRGALNQRLPVELIGENNFWVFAFFKNVAAYDGGIIIFRFIILLVIVVICFYMVVLELLVGHFLF